MAFVSVEKSASLNSHVAVTFFRYLNFLAQQKVLRVSKGIRSHYHANGNAVIRAQHFKPVGAPYPVYRPYLHCISPDTAPKKTSGT
jgi:hypothetical protein